MAKLTATDYTAEETAAIAATALVESLVAKSTTMRGKTVVRHDPDKLIDAVNRLSSRGFVVAHARRARGT